jgi:hypothetical protein
MPTATEREDVSHMMFWEKDTGQIAHPSSIGPRSTWRRSRASPILVCPVFSEVMADEDLI